MSRKKQIKRIFSVFLATVLLISAIPLSLAVQNLLAEETPPKIIREATELREESVKHFLCEDGSYIAATYSAPVHYKENGEWKEIDNSLSLDRTTLSESGKPTYTTKAGGLSVSIPQSFSDGQKITARNKGYEIGFGVNANQNDVFIKASASVVELGTLSSNTEAAKLDTVKSINNVSTASTLDSSDTEAYNAEIMTVDNQSSAVTYEKIMPDTDFEYIVTSNSIKENIVVYEPKSEYTYSFDMDFGELIPIVKEDNSIKLVEKNNTDETIFYITAPYMYDANNEESMDIEMSLVKKDDIYVMTLQANANWINAEERTFPIVIDPTVYMSFNDVFVMDGLLNANTTKTGLELRVGKNLTNITRTYIKPTLPSSIPTGSYISNAYLVFKEDYFYRGYAEKDIYFQVYDCYDVNYWSPDSVTWNNQPYSNSANGHKNGHSPISSMICGVGKETYTFDIKTAVTRWLNGGVNNGLMLASSNEDTKIQVDFHSSRALNSENHPQMYINYEVPSVSISNWETDSQAKESSLFTITTGNNWTAYSDVDWISLSFTSGSGCGTNKIIVTENTSAKTRIGTITVKIGNTIIGSITVTQLGAEPSLVVDQSYFKIDSEGKTVEVKVTSNVEWEILNSDEHMINQIDVINNDESSPLSKTLSISISENSHSENNESGGKIRIGTLTLKDTENYDLSTVITFKQYNAVTEYLFDIAEDETLTLKSSSAYNHALATWAMELSYAAYNYPDGTELPYIPGAFMNGLEDTAADVLRSLGFSDDNIIEENYTESDCGAYTIAYRNIGVAVTENTNNTDERTEENDNIAVYRTNISGTSHASLYNMGSDTGSSQLTNSRPLVVVAVRGSVTNDDWDNNFKTQFVPWDNKFAEMKDTIADNLESYISELSNPIILVTGHSLGAAIANLLAADLSQTMGIQNVYAYTFGTPNVLTEALEPDAVPYTNIFNILNTNDVVTYVPFTFWLPVVNFWSRHGIDIPLNMLYSDCIPTVPIGLFSHSMAVYMAWMNNNPNMTHETIMAESAEARTRGLLPLLARIKCPVGVTIKDSDGNIIAYESQEEGVTYPEITDTGVVSWVDDDGAKVFFIPAGVDAASIEIEAYDYGSMDFTIGTAGTTDETEIKVFNDVSLYPGKEFLVEVSDDVLPEDTRLFVTEDGEVVGEVTDTNPFFKGVTANPTEAVYGETVTFTLVTDNTVTAMMLHNTNADDHVNLVPGEGEFNVVSSGENELTWTVTNSTEIMNIGENVYDISVQSDGVWYFYENVIALNVTAS